MQFRIQNVDNSSKPFYFTYRLEESFPSKILIVDYEFSLSYVDMSGVRAIEVDQTQSKWGVSIEIPEEFSKVKVLGKEVSSDTKDGYRRILMTGKKMRVEAEK